MFNFFKKNKNKETIINNVSTDTIADNDVIKKINLNKEEVNKICLKKKPLISLKAKVKLVLDYSGSMSWFYDDGTIQEVVEKIVPLALQFDDDGELEVYLFSDDVKQIKNCNINNVNGYVEKYANWEYGGTEYSPVIKKISKNCKNDLPEYIIFITDGDNSDKLDTTIAIKEVSKKPIFFQFIGVGNSKFKYLEQLDDMRGRYVDNADFFKVSEMSDITYDKLLTEFPTWLENEKVKDMLK